MLEVEKSLAKRTGSILNPADQSSDRAPYKAVQTGWCIKTPAWQCEDSSSLQAGLGEEVFGSPRGELRSFRSLLLSLEVRQGGRTVAW